MKKYLIRILTANKEKLQKINKYHDFSKGNLLTRVLKLFYWTVILTQKSAVSKIIKKLEKQLVFIAYSNTCNDGSPEQEFTECLYNNKDKFRMVEFSESSDTAFMLVYSYEIEKHLKLFLEKGEKVYAIAKIVSDGKAYKCETCDISYFGVFPYVYRYPEYYRGRLYECYSCRQYSNVGIHNIIDYKNKYGSEKTIKKAITTGFTNR